MAINVDRMKQLFFRSSEMIAHFGRNPVSGGSPPRDRRIREVIVRMVGVLFHRSETELIEIEEFNDSAMNSGIVRIM